MNHTPPHPPAEGEDGGELPERLPDAVLTALRQHDSLSARDATPVAAQVRAAELPSVDAVDAVDRAVLAEAQAHFAARDTAARRRAASGAPHRVDRTARHRPVRGTRRRRVAAVVSTAAAVLVAVLLVQPMLFGPADPDDIDGSGQVDILDAFALARQQASGRAISDARIDALTARIVALEPPGSPR